MIVGTGMIARAFHGFGDDDNVVIFASGVSNSQETAEAAYARERDLLLRTMDSNEGKLIVYFSTCSIEDPELSKTRYVLHKTKIEQFIHARRQRYLIFRLPQVVGRGTNDKTLTNFLYTKIKNGEPFTIWKNAVRYIIDIDDVVEVVTHIIKKNAFKNKVIKIVSRPYRIIEIVKVLEGIAQTSATYSLEEKGSFYDVDDSEIQGIKDSLNMKFDASYLERVLRKYYC